MRIPRLAKARPAVRVGDGDGRHGVRDLGQWRIERDFIAAHVIVVAEGAGLYGGELSGAEQGHAMPLVIDDHLHLCGQSFFHILQQLAAHMLGEMYERSALLWVRLFVDQEDSFGGIRIAVGVAESGARADRSCNG